MASPTSHIGRVSNKVPKLQHATRASRSSKSAACTPPPTILSLPQEILGMIFEHSYPPCDMAKYVGRDFWERREKARCRITNTTYQAGRFRPKVDDFLVSKAFFAQATPVFVKHQIVVDMRTPDCQMLIWPLINGEGIIYQNATSVTTRTGQLLEYIVRLPRLTELTLHVDEDDFEAAGTDCIWKHAFTEDEIFELGSVRRILGTSWSRRVKIEDGEYTASDAPTEDLEIWHGNLARFDKVVNAALLSAAAEAACTHADANADTRPSNLDHLPIASPAIATPRHDTMSGMSANQMDMASNSKDKSTDSHPSLGEDAAILIEDEMAQIAWASDKGETPQSLADFDCDKDIQNDLSPAFVDTHAVRMNCNGEPGMAGINVAADFALCREQSMTFPSSTDSSIVLGRLPLTTIGTQTDESLLDAVMFDGRHLTKAAITQTENLANLRERFDMQGQMAVMLDDVRRRYEAYQALQEDMLRAFLCAMSIFQAMAREMSVGAAAGTESLQHPGEDVKPADRIQDACVHLPCDFGGRCAVMLRVAGVFTLCMVVCGLLTAVLML